ncbi:tetratricopeptide repeat protein [Shewanella khirikhana]|uniref:tetratricopeptide repeat protein n=1 Tax=Shewanella khirikhana TaxID=1965282 RepID=UPI0030CCD321
MQTEIQHAIALRKEGLFEASRKVLMPLLEDSVYAATAHLQIAWSYDNEGREAEAVQHYEAALSSGALTSIERFDALFGLASTFRSLGQYATALEYFEQTVREYPEHLEAKPFYAMCLYNLGRHKEAMSMLLELLVVTTDSDAIKQYQRAILLYAQDLDRTW